MAEYVDNKITAPMSNAEVVHSYRYTNDPAYKSAVDWDVAHQHGLEHANLEIIPAGRGLAAVEGKTGSKFANFYKNNDKFLMNGDGSPKVFYHGTKGNFDEFAHGIDGITKQKLSGEGYYVTSDPALASKYSTQEGGNIMPLHIRANKIKQYEQPTNKLTKPPKIDAEYVAQLQKEGYEGLAGMRYPSEVIVFNPNQLKSINNMAPTASNNIMRAAAPIGLTQIQDDQ